MHGQDTTIPMGAGMVTDPVCGMQVPADTPRRSAYAGGDYRFCSRHCLERFEAEPGRYAVPGAPQDARSETAAAGTCCPDHGGHAQEAPHAGATTYTGPMSPEIRQPGPGSRPKCGMALEPEPAPQPETRVEYTCPMHQEIVRDRPGNCPKCGMALEPRTVTLDGRNEELFDMTRRFWVCAALALPLFVLAMVADLATDRLPAGVTMGTVQWIQFALATPVVLWGSWPFFVRGWQSLMTWNLNMFTLIGLGVAVAWGYSVVALLLPGLFPPAMRMADGTVHVYFEAAAVITALVLLGQVLELRARGSTNAAVKLLLGMTPNTARQVRDDGSEVEVDLSQVEPGDLLRVRPGRRCRWTAPSHRATAPSIGSRGVRP